MPPITHLGPGGEDGRVSARSKGRSRGRGRAKSTVSSLGSQQYNFDAEIGGTISSPTQFISGSNFSSSYSQNRGRGQRSGRRSRGRIKLSTPYANNAAGELHVL